MTTQEHPVTEHHLNALMTWHVEGSASGGTLAMGEVQLQPGDEPPLHIHAREDEVWYILDGTILFQRGVERIVREPGQAILLPRGIPHGFAVQTPKARILHLYTPAGIEEAFHAVSRATEPLAIIEAAYAERGVTFTGPPLPVLLAAERELR